MTIEIEDLHVTRMGFHAVKGLSIVIPGGNWVGVVGANGSGKTSLLRAVSGRLAFEKGSVTIDGIDRTRDQAWRAQHIGISVDCSSLPGTLSGRELFAILDRGLPRALTDNDLSELKEALAFDPYVDRPMAALSAGMKQRIAIYCAFIGGGEAVILDEPFNWLDPICAFEVRTALRNLVDQKGVTLITALHDMSTLAVCCDSGFMMSQGCIIKTLSKEALRKGALDFAAFESELIGLLKRAPQTAL